MGIPKGLRALCVGPSGAANAAGAPEISGDMTFCVNNGNGSGAFSFPYGGSYGQLDPVGGAAYHFDFKASRCSGIYGTSETVMPKSVNVPIMIYLGVSS